jgi:hypothetical protein
MLSAYVAVSSSIAFIPAVRILCKTAVRGLAARHAGGREADRLRSAGLTEQRGRF